MSHTCYAANGKVSHIHRHMCEWDYTIDLSTKPKKDAMLELPTTTCFYDKTYIRGLFYSWIPNIPLKIIKELCDD
jgi:hypothetical protein